MDAIQFIKEHGVEQAKICLSICACQEDNWFIHNGDLISGSDFDVLKRLVESVDLIEFCGGNDIAKELDADFLGENFQAVQQAIADYEAIYL